MISGPRMESLERRRQEFPLLPNHFESSFVPPCTYCPSGSHASVNSHSSRDQPLPAHPSFHLTQSKSRSFRGPQALHGRLPIPSPPPPFFFTPLQPRWPPCDSLAPSQRHGPLCACRSLCQGHPCRRCLPGRTLLNVTPSERPPLRVTSGAASHHAPPPFLLYLSHSSFRF